MTNRSQISASVFMFVVSKTRNNKKEKFIIQKYTRSMNRLVETNINPNVGIKKVYKTSIDVQMVLPILVRVNLRVIGMKVYSTLLCRGQRPPIALTGRLLVTDTRILASLETAQTFFFYICMVFLLWLYSSIFNIRNSSLKKKKKKYPPCVGARWVR